MSKAHPIAATEIPPHMIDDDVRLSAAQKKVFGKANRREAREEAKAEEKKAKKAEK